MLKFLFSLCLMLIIYGNSIFAQDGKARLIILADMGHDPDEEQQITHLLMCSNEFELEGLIAVTGRFFRQNPPDTVKKLMPHLFYRLIDGYDLVYPNLQFHASGYKSPADLREIVASGQPGNGLSDVGPGKTSAGARLIINAVKRIDPRPLYIVINSGANTLAQALFDLRLNNTGLELKNILTKIRVFDNGGQDESGAWICHEFPDLFYIRSNVQTRAYGGPANDNLGPHCWQPYPYSCEGQHMWAREHIQTNHGSLGKLYPDRFVGQFHYMEGGGTVPWLSLIHQGLSDLSRPWWGGWSGRYSQQKIFNVPSGYAIVQKDELQYRPYATYTDAIEIVDQWTNPIDNKLYRDQYTPVWRWRQAMWNDFKCRMDWCVKEFTDANHAPVAGINGDIMERIHILSVEPGEEIPLDASSSFDPDEDELTYKWWVYKEVSSYAGEISLPTNNEAKINFKVPSDASGNEIHLILEVSDKNKIASLVDYRRIVLQVK